jgi:hypothetical protein
MGWGKVFQRDIYALSQGDAETFPITGIQYIKIKG